MTVLPPAGRQLHHHPHPIGSERRLDAPQQFPLIGPQFRHRSGVPLRFGWCGAFDERFQSAAFQLERGHRCFMLSAKCGQCFLMLIVPMIGASPHEAKAPSNQDAVNQHSGRSDSGL